ncbi:MAG TPA: ATP-binding protein [Solirubrobacterales bacterium]|nr:ATP-binding protein [Solirubrobacterales bacterium]
MLAELTRVAAGWPLVVSLAAALVAQGLLAGRRRMSLNEALHELRRPLQALVLVAPTSAAGKREADLPLQAARALERLDREINGGGTPARRDPVAIGPLLEAAVRRWQGPAVAAGATLRREGCAEATLSGDPDGLSRALDNLIVNAIEHGGPLVSVGAELAPPVLSLTVADSGQVAPAGRRAGRRPLAAIAGRGRRGHGLRVVRRVAAEHGGEFHLRQLDRGMEAVVELPLAGGDAW